MINPDQYPSIDFSGAPPLIIPKALAHLWRGTADPNTSEYRAPDFDNPVTDYDRLCISVRQGNALLKIGGSSAIALYTEFDMHAWDADRLIVACDAWLLTDREFKDATWLDPIHFNADHTEYLLLNSAADPATQLEPDDFLPLIIPVGRYVLETAFIQAEYYGIYHRFTPVSSYLSSLNPEPRTLNPSPK